jgi:uncharacterized protein YqhQ
VENVVSRRKKDKEPKEKPLNPEEIKKKLSDPWISMRNAIIVIVIVSVILAVWIAVQGNPNVPFWDRVLPPLVLAISIPVVAVLFYLINRYIIRR